MLKYHLLVMLMFVFVIKVDLYALENGQTPAEQQDLGAQGMRFPCLSPDGKWIAFSLYGDLWKVSSAGGRAQRLTLHSADDVKPRWSPDGKTIAFASMRSGNFDVWTIPADGGIPTQLTFHSTWDSISDWSADGSYIVFFSYRSGALELWKIGKNGGMAFQLTSTGGRDASVSPDGKMLVYCYGEASVWKKGYQGSSNWDIYAMSLEKQDIPKRLTTFIGNDFYPSYSSDAKFIYYIREGEVIGKDGNKQNVYNLWKMDASGENNVQVTNFDSDITTPYLARDGKSVVFEKDFRIWQMDFASKKINVIPVVIVSDTKAEQLVERVITEGNEMGHYSPDGKQIAFVLNGDIWIMSADGGKSQQLTSGYSKDQWPRFSPNGKFLAYFSNKSGNDDIFIIDLEEKKERQLTTHKANDFFHSWSPDGKVMLFTSERSGNRDIWMLAIQGGVPKKLTDSPQSEDDAVFSPDGKWIAFDSGKGGSQQIWIMPADGDYQQARKLTNHSGLTQVPSWSADSRLLAYENTDSQGNTSIWCISHKGGASMQIVADAALPCWSFDGSYILFESERMGKKNIYQINAPKEINVGKRISFLARTKIDVSKERLQVFEEAWQAIYQNFYDPKFHNTNWKGVKQKYQSIVADVRTDLELDTLINRMVGELKASHVGVNSLHKDTQIETGYLGWELASVAEPRVLKVKSLLRDGPADKVWIRPGDYIFKIADQLVQPGINLAQILNNQIGKEIKVFVSPSLDPSEGRYVSVIPVGINEIETLKYRHWLLQRIKTVKSLTQNRVIYVHLSEMNGANLQKFREIVQQTIERMDGMILDLRNNGGGLIHQQLMEILMKRPYLAYRARGQRQKRYQPTLYWHKPVVLLINEKSFSDAEVFAHAFKYLKRGEIVGVPSAGGVIGTRDITLLNQSTFRVPRVGYYSLQGENLEGLGVTPDYVVLETPKTKMADEDPQLIKAIEVIMRKLLVDKVEKSKPD